MEVSHICVICQLSKTKTAKLLSSSYHTWGGGTERWFYMITKLIGKCFQNIMAVLDPLELFKHLSAYRTFI